MGGQTTGAQEEQSVFSAGNELSVVSFSFVHATATGRKRCGKGKGSRQGLVDDVLMQT